MRNAIVDDRRIGVCVARQFKLFQGFCALAQLFQGIGQQIAGQPAQILVS